MDTRDFVAVPGIEPHVTPQNFHETTAAFRRSRAGAGATLSVIVRNVSSRLLIVDDDAELTGPLSELLTQESFTVDVNGGREDAAAAAASGGYSLVILDLMLPKINRFELLKQIRQRSDVPVILLTASGDDVDRIVGLELGADDYVPKPFNPRELIARIRAVLRRVEARRRGTERESLRVGEVTLDAASRTVTRHGERIDLTSIEFDLLRALLASAGQTIDRESLAENVLGRRFDPFDRSIDMHISKLRRKLGPQEGGDERIKTVRGVGYLYALPVQPS
jgi:two-component system, OmpR family, response regulator CpxR